ncbi:MAG TPA: alpha/beta hydrolase [Terrimicrobiaceae bacterium]
MKSSLRVLAKASFLLCVLALLIVGLVLAWFASWRSDKLSALDSASEIAETDQGKVEYLIRGDGPTVLVLHGAPGGYDQGMLLGSIFAEEEFVVVAPSRPGYLRTPLATGQSPEQQADAMAALMQTMGIPSVAVLASSYGAPAAVQFVLRHPEKVWAMVLLSPVTTKFDAKLPWTEPGQLVFDKFGEDLGAWLAVEAVERDPQTILKRILESENGGTSAQRDALAEFIVNDIDQLEWFRSLIGTFVPRSARESGVRNDLQQVRTLAELPFEQIHVPTLIVHGTVDKLVPLSEAQSIAARIPGATLYPVEGAGHLVELGPRALDMQTHIVQFLHERSGGQSQP